MNGIANAWMWLGFSVFIVIALTVDVILLNKKFAHPYQSIRVATIWTLVWIFCALIFNGILWFYLYETTDLVTANKQGITFLTGYLIEKSLSLDNLFVFYIIFKQLQIPLAFQQRVFTYGIWSAIVMRLVLILLGTWLVSHFHWVLYLMGVFLLITGLKMLFAEEKQKDLADTFLLKAIKKFFRITHELQNNHFFIKKGQLIYATPLFVALIFIEISDLIFAIDSIPAILAISQDPFIVWSSNIFAILGLRAMYFMLSGMLQRFHLLRHGISLILVFIGFKMVIEPWLSISTEISLGVITLILITFTVLSLMRKQGK